MQSKPGKRPWFRKCWEKLVVTFALLSVFRCKDRYWNLNIAASDLDVESYRFRTTFFTTPKFLTRSSNLIFRKGMQQLLNFMGAQITQSSKLSGHSSTIVLYKLRRGLTLVFCCLAKAAWNSAPDLRTIRILSALFEISVKVIYRNTCLMWVPRWLSVRWGNTICVFPLVPSVPLSRTGIK